MRWENSFLGWELAAKLKIYWTIVLANAEPMSQELEGIYCLGIESTAHTFGAAVASDAGAIFADVGRVYSPTLGHGIHPREAAQHHAQVASQVMKDVFEEAGVKPAEIDAIAFSAGPGLGPVLRVGATVARSAAHFLGVPLIPVHHGVGHIEIGILTGGCDDPLVVLVSGGHTAITACIDRRWRILGETEDIAVGNLLDTFAREMGLPPPGGPAVEQLAKKGGRLVDLPYTVKGNDVSYSGILTAALARAKEAGLEEVCYSIQEVAFSMLAEATERVLALTEKKELLVVGGVAANAKIKEKLAAVARGLDARFAVVDSRYTGDCGAQIAWTGVLAYRGGIKVPVEKSRVIPRWRLDEVDVPWRSAKPI